MRHRMDRTKQIVICSLIFATSMSGCSDAIDKDEWDLDEEFPEKVQDTFTQGIYETQWEIHKDECEPKLQRLFDHWDEWPPPRKGITMSSPDDTSSGTPSYWMHHYLPRHFGQAPGASGYLNLDFTPDERHLFEIKHPPEHEIHQCPPLGSPHAEYRHHFVGTLVDTNTIVIEVETEWGGDYDECEEDVELVTPWIPEDECTEAYTITMTLDEVCKPLGECKLIVRHGSHNDYENESIEEAPLRITDFECKCD